MYEIFSHMKMFTLLIMCRLLKNLAFGPQEQEGLVDFLIDSSTFSAQLFLQNVI